jgi:hypothetical protein
MSASAPDASVRIDRAGLDPLENFVHNSQVKVEPSGPWGRGVQS